MWTDFDGGKPKGNESKEVEKGEGRVTKSPFLCFTVERFSLRIGAPETGYRLVD
jgi:hypothetical protein